jgi:hypothetical protein
MKHWMIALLAFFAFQTANANPLKHTETLMVGNTKVTIGFNEYPLQAERSLDLTINPEGGITNKKAAIEFIRPNGEKWFTTTLPRYTRDRSLWGFDNQAFPDEGTWQMKLNINGSIASVPLEVGARPAGPPSNLIIMLALIPILGIFSLAIRAWLKVRPLRHIESRTW